ncbi:MAG TPA: hypothetical protein VFF13_05000 [archaeon]|nr:hypothetical protein [archaeon]
MPVAKRKARKPITTIHPLSLKGVKEHYRSDFSRLFPSLANTILAKQFVEIQTSRFMNQSERHFAIIALLEKAKRRMKSKTEHETAKTFIRKLKIIPAEKNEVARRRKPGRSPKR